MAKKKQLAGKKTKLAKLPLTQVLAGQAEEASPWGPSPDPLSDPLAPAPFASLPPLPPHPAAPEQPAARQLPFSWEEAQEGAAGPLAAAYLHLVRELAALRSHLLPGAAGGTGSLPGSLPPQVPPPRQILGALRLAREGLQDLHRLLSRS